MIKKNLFMPILTVVILIALVISGCQSQEADSAGTKETTSDKPVTIKLTHFQPASDDQPAQASAVKFKEYVEKETNGSVKVELYPASQLGDATQVLEGLSLGSIQMAIVHDGPVASLYPPIGVFNLPYLFKDQNEAWAAFDSEFEKSLADDMVSQTGLRVLALADNGIRHFTNSKHEIKNVEDLKGMKMRIQPGKLYEEFVTALDASPSAIPWTDLPAALEQGVVDGQENGVTNILAASLYQSQKYVTLDSHIYSFHAYLMNDKFLKGLTEEQQKAIIDGVNLVKTTHREMTAEQDMNAGKILAEKGMIVTELSPEEIDKFRQATQPAVMKWMKEEVGDKWVDGMLKEVETNRNSN
jgi:C4-dicarboxylate-binding protein DctP